MKNKLKHYLKLGIFLFGITFVLINCEKDFAKTQIESESKITVEIINLRQVESNRKVVEKLEKIISTSKEKSTKTYSRDIHYNSEYGFTINTDYVKYLESGDYNSYNFILTRDEPEDDNVENLFLTLNSEGNYDAFIIKYDFTFDEVDELTVDILNSRTTIYTPIDYDSSFLSAKTLSNVCVETWDWEIVGYNYSSDCGCEAPVYSFVLQSRECTWIGGGGGGSPTDGDPPPDGDGTTNDCDTCGANGGNTNGDDANTTEDTIISTPNMMSLQDAQNCEKIKNLMKKKTTVPNQFPNVRAMLNQLKDSTTVINKEIGWYLSPSSTDPNIYSPYYFEGIENEDGFAMNTGLNVVDVVMHIHYINEATNKKQLSVPSLSDIYQIYASLTFGNITTPDIFTTFLVTEHGTKYAIQIDDVQTFLASKLATQYFPNYQFSNFVNSAEKKYSSYRIKPKKSNVKNEKRFAKFLAKENLGLNLFKANEDFTQWTLIKYENGGITETPCN